MIEIVTISWNPVPGSTGTLVEYEVFGTTTWVVPSSPPNPTIYSSYSVLLDTTLNYNIRLTTYGASCGPQSTTTQLFAINTTTSTTTTTTTGLPTTSTTTTSTTHTTTTTTSSTTTTTTTLAVCRTAVCLGNNATQICDAEETLVYYLCSEGFEPGTTLYYDEGLTDPILTYTYVGQVVGSHDGQVVGTIYNLNPGNGEIGAATLYNCTTAPVLITDYSGETSVTTVTINGVVPSGITFPTTGGDTENGTTTSLGVETIYVQWVTSSTNCSLILTDSDGNHSCINFTGSGNYTFTGQQVNINGVVEITFHNGNAC